MVLSMRQEAIREEKLSTVIGVSLSLPDVVLHGSMMFIVSPTMVAVSATGWFLSMIQTVFLFFSIPKKL